MTTVTRGRQRRGGHQSAAGREAAAMLLFLEDVRVAMLLLNDARYRALERMFGVGRAEANIVSFVAAAVMVDAVDRRTSRISAPGAPKPANVALSAAATGTALGALAGTAGLGGPGSLLIAGALIYKVVGNPTRRAVRSVARSPLRLRTAVMAQGQRLAAAAAERAREAAAERSHETPTTTGTS